MDYPEPLIERLESPNCGVRGPEAKISQIICHTTIGSVKSAINTFMNKASQRSAHFIIAKSGKIYQLVDVEKRAWHATLANQNSIGVEFESLSGEAMTRKQDESALVLFRWLLQGHKLPYTAITGHRYATPRNPTLCPGALFGDRSWDSLAQWRFRHFEEFR